MRTNKLCILVIIIALLFGIAVIFGSTSLSLADVAVGDIIDKANWQKAQGLLPDAMMEYLQKGYITIKVGKLNYDPGDILCNEYKESLKKNRGRYGVSNVGELVDKKTGVIDPMDVIGIPFPELDMRDPHVCSMMNYNHYYYLSLRGNLEMTSTMYFVGQKMERYIAGPELTMSFIGTEKNIEQQSGLKYFGRKLNQLFIMKITDPYELNGLATMSWGYGDNTPDKSFAFIPALRRVRVMSAAARSDAMFGTDYALDDASGGFMGKPRDFNCKYLRTQDGLARYVSPDVIGMFRKNDGTYELKKPYPSTLWGFQTPGWQGKPWAPTNHVWVKRKMHVIECLSKDPYYNYGKFELWYDPKCFNWAHKVIWDRSGKRWKVMNSGNGAYMSSDGEIGKVDAAFGDWIYDEQRDHATSIDEFSTKEKKIFRVKNTTEMFTMGGLTQFAK